MRGCFITHGELLHVSPLAEGVEAGIAEAAGFLAMRAQASMFVLALEVKAVLGLPSHK
jgi:hypothetical protein